MGLSSLSFIPFRDGHGSMKFNRLSTLLPTARSLSSRVPANYSRETSLDKAIVNKCIGTPLYVLSLVLSCRTNESVAISSPTLTLLNEKKRSVASSRIEISYAPILPHRGKMVLLILLLVQGFPSCF